MAFNRFDDRRSTYNFEKTPSRGRTFLKNTGDGSGNISGESPFFRRKPFLNGNASVPSSVASSRESSLDRGSTYVNGRVPSGEAGLGAAAFHNVVGRVMSSPKMTLRKKFQVMRSGSFSDAKSTIDNKRKKWLLERSGSLRLPGKYKPKAEESPWSSPEADRRGSLPMNPEPHFRDRSLERHGSYHSHDLDSGKIKGFVNR